MIVIVIGCFLWLECFWYISVLINTNFKCVTCLICVCWPTEGDRPGGQKERYQKDRMAHIHRRARRRGQQHLGEVHRTNGHQRHGRQPHWPGHRHRRRLQTRNHQITHLRAQFRTLQSIQPLLLPAQHSTASCRSWRAFVEAEDLGGALRNRVLSQVGRGGGRGLRRTVATRLDVNVQVVQHDLDTLDGQFDARVRVAAELGQGGGLLGVANGEHGLGTGDQLFPLLGEVVHFGGERVRKVVCVLVWGVCGP